MFWSGKKLDKLAKEHIESVLGCRARELRDGGLRTDELRKLWNHLD